MKLATTRIIGQRIYLKSTGYGFKDVCIEFATTVSKENGKLGKENEMKKLTLVLMTLLMFGQAGCEFIGGALVGAGATGAGYEYNSYRQMQQLEDDYKNEKISREEYEKRKQQIEAGSIVY